MRMRITNPDYLPSDCDRCRRNTGTECVLAAHIRKPIAQAKIMHDRCGYYMKRGECLWPGNSKQTSA